MKRLLLILLTAHFSLLTLFSQAPQGFNYQAVARDTDGSLLASETIDVKIGIRSGNETGPLVWEETHTVTTNEFGLFTLKIGDITATPGYAMKWSLLDVSEASSFEELKEILAENERRRNAVIGKALQEHNSGNGKIIALISLQ